MAHRMWLLGLLAVIALEVIASGADMNVCFEKISDLPAIFLQEHPIGNALAVGTQDGMIRLMVRPQVRSGNPATNFSVFLDLTNRVYSAGQQGLLSFAFHPKFSSNGRFFVSYICHGLRFADCQGPCACSSATNCTGASASCPFNTIVAEYSAGSNPLNATSLNATEVRKILKFGRPGPDNNGGHIWFGSDGLLYYASGDGSSATGTLNAAQNGAVLLGKILRLDVDTAANASLYGTYRVPSTNPFVSANSVVRPEVFALGFRNPWRCSSDTQTSSMLCGDIGPQTTQLVQLVTGGANYGWPSAWGSTVLATKLVNTYRGNITEPLYKYEGMAVIGGYVYRAKRNPCLQNRYISGDEDGQMFLSVPFGSGSKFENASYSVAPDARAPQTGSSQSIAFPADDMLHSWAVDASNELYRLSSSGVYRVTDMELCGGTCAKSAGMMLSGGAVHALAMHILVAAIAALLTLF